ncbi:P-loop containing nucleoside triphosphate hydrolase protein [Aspergillus terricola var. indicus]
MPGLGDPGLGHYLMHSKWNAAFFAGRRSAKHKFPDSHYRSAVGWYELASRNLTWDIFLGDVIISDSVIEYDFGRQYPEIRALLNGLRAAMGHDELQTQAFQYLNTLQQKGTTWNRPQINDVLFKADYLHMHYRQAPSIRCCCLDGDVPGKICEDALEKNCYDLGCDPGQIIRRRGPSDANISVHIGTVASGNRVMKSGQHRDTIARKEGVIGFEMEGVGVWDHIPCLIIKGVCDYADTHKSKAWQAYAAATGASAAKAFLEYWRPGKHEDARTNRHLMIPFGRNPYFVGRQDEIHQLEELILMPDGAKKFAITGLGGVGKTQVALELAYRMQDRDAQCSIFWIPCTSHEAVEQAYMAIAQMVGIQGVKPAEVKERIKTYFSHQEGKWLLIFDNADDIEMWTEGSNNTLPLKDFLPFNNQGHIIFTSRNRELALDLVSSHVVHIGEFDKKSGVEFLEKSLVCKDLLDDSPATMALLEQLTFLPLAISQATAYINKKGIPISDYLLLLEEQEADVVELLSKDFGDDGRYKNMQNPVAKTWLVSFCQIQKQDQLAAEYLSLLACFNPRNIPQSLLPLSGSRLEMIDALGLLSAYSFITIQPGSRFITLHRLVHLATRNWMRDKEQFSVYISKAADRLSEIFPDNQHTNRQLWREYLPHALFLLSEHEVRKQKEQYIDCIMNVGRCLYSDGRYNEAEQLQVQVLETWKQVLGPEHPDTLTSMANLASTYRNQGRMANLAFTRKSLRNIPAALALMGRCVELRNEVLGSDHPHTISSSNTLRNWEIAQQTCQDHLPEYYRILL